MNEGFEKFEINDNDWDQAQNPLRKRKRPTKDEQIYGMWAERNDEDSDHAEPGTSRGFGFSTSSKKKDYSAPVNFVSGGVKHGDKVEKTNNQDDEGDAEDDNFEASKFRSKRYYGVEGTKKKEKGVKGINAFAGLRAATDFNGERMANWEKYTKGIGSKLLQKMGHKQGAGLGKEGKGISEPIQAALRPGRGAVGLYGPEVKGPKADQEKINEGNDDRLDASQDGKVKGRWRKNATKQQFKMEKATKVQFKTYDDVLNSESSMKTNWSTESHSTVKIIDMTGKEQKVYSGYEAYKMRERSEKAEEEEETDRNFDIPELRHNLDCIVNMTEEAIIRNDRQLRHLKDQNITLKYEENELEKQVEVEKRERDSLKQLLNLLDEFGDKSEAGQATLENCRNLIETLKDNYYTEYKMFSLSDIAITSALPLFKQHFKNWNPLESANHGIDLAMEWKLLIEQSSSWVPRSEDLDDMDPFHRILWESWMPQIRRAALIWEPRESGEMINVINMWSSVLPLWILENVLELIILPRLQAEVEDWDPTSDTLPIHVWIHPWLPLMGDRLQPVYGPIRHKLSRALALWNPSDVSAKKILQPWQNVFAAGTMECFLVQNILPKLEDVLADFQVNPANQSLDAINWVMDWLDMLGPAHLTDAFLRHFFPKWLNALHSWLGSPMVNYDEVMHWYNGWKSLFADFLTYPTILNQFKRAMEMMNMAVSGAPLVAPGPTNVQYTAKPVNSMSEASIRASMLPSGVPTTFKELLDQKANEYNILFMPLPNKSYEGKPIYRFGLSQIYLDRNVPFVFRNNVWIPVSVDQLLSYALG